MSESGTLDFSFLDQVDVPAMSYSAGDTIVAEAAPATEMYLVREGRVSIEVNRKPVEQIGPGGIFGEMALIADAPRSAAVVAAEDCRVIPIDQRLFLILVQETPNFALDVMRVLSRRLRNMNQYV
jgi:CRP/FNR family cyclic AMP-dependent transcriptional regulator